MVISGYLEGAEHPHNMKHNHIFNLRQRRTSANTEITEFLTRSVSLPLAPESVSLW